jgi:hypothetical protein
MALGHPGVAKCAFRVSHLIRLAVIVCVSVAAVDILGNPLLSSGAGWAAAVDHTVELSTRPFVVISVSRGRSDPSTGPLDPPIAQESN